MFSSLRRYLLPLSLAIVAAALLVFYWPGAGNADYVFVTQAEISASDSFERPDSSSQWRNIPLPRSWLRDELHSSDARHAWYRVPLPAQAHDNNWNQLLILRHMMNLEVWLDDRYLGSAGPVTPTRSQRNWNRPVMWTIPQSWITGEDQTLYFRVHSEPKFGVMSPLILGDYRSVSKRYGINHFLQIDLVRIGLMALLFIGAASLFAWIKTYQQRWLLMVLMSTGWSLPLLYIVAPSVSFAEFDFLRLSHWGTATGAICLLAFIYAFYLNTPLHRLRWLIALPVIHGALLAITPDSQVVNIGSAGQLLAQTLFVILVVKLLRHRSAQDRKVLAVVAGLSVMLLAAMHDVSLVMSANVERWRWDMPVSYITQPLMLMILAWLGLSAFIEGLRELSRLNRTLKSRLVAAEEDIRQVYAQQENLEREIRLEAERETVYRDLHDDLGARLLSLVLKTDQGSARDLARSALQDLRDIVSRVLADEQLVSAVLADSMAEHEARANILEKTFSWQIDDELDSQTLDGRRILNIRLLLRELIGSCLRLPDARSLSFSATLDHHDHLNINLCHDGSGSQPVSPLLRKRLTALQAELQQTADQDQPAARQCCITVRISLGDERLQLAR